MHCICFRIPSEIEWKELEAKTELKEVSFVASNQSVYDWILNKECRAELLNLPNRRGARLDLHRLMHDFAHQIANDNKGSILNRLSVDDTFYSWYLVRRQVNGAAIATYEEYLQVEKSLANTAEKIHVYSNSELANVSFPDQVLVHDPAKSELAKKRSARDLVFYCSVIAIRALRGFFDRVSTGKNIFLYGSFSNQKLFTRDGRRLIDGDPIFQYLYDEIGEREDFTTASVYKNFGLKSYPSWWASIAKPKYASSHCFFEWFALKALILPNSRQRILSFNSKLNQNEKVEYEHAFYAYLNTKTNHQKTQLLLGAIRYEAGLLMLKKMNPKAIGGDGEWTFAKYPILMAAKRLGVPTYGIQHGIISDQNIDYTFFSKDLALDPFVDRTIVWGNGAIERLSKRSVYPMNSLHTSGQVRTDVIQGLKKNNPTFLISNWTGKDKILLYASQYLPRSTQMRDRLIRDVLQLQNEIDGLRVIVKPHPREMSELQIYEDIAKELGVSLEVSTEDLYGLISIADLIVTFYSTVGTEALYFGKELLVLDYDGVDGSGYISEGVAHHCDSFDALKSTVDRFYNNNLDMLEAQRQAYVSKIAHSIDGEVRFRIIDAIADLSLDK